MRKTKIVCTLGPATDDPKVLTEMIKSGMDVARLNFSHGTYEDHQRRMDLFKKVRAKLGTHTALMLDTKGPEIRIGAFENGSVELVEGQQFTLTTAECMGNAARVSVSYKNLPSDIAPKMKILLDDGLIELEVIKTTGSDIVCVVKNGGVLASGKSVNIPGAGIRMPYMSQKDRDDIIFGIKNDVDFIAASFVRNAYDVLEVRRVLDLNGGSDIHVIAKIENAEGVQNIDEILKVCDGIMVARGDMGVEVPIEQLPRIQKMLIKKCYLAGKKAIIATQMLESMIRNPRPTRAEVSDIANAIYDGTSAIMLSGETAIGKYPVESVRTMARVAENTEGDINYKERFKKAELETSTVTNAISHATCTTAHDLGAAAIITVTKSGHTARMVSKFRPACPIVATAMSEKVCRQLSLSWGVIPILVEEKNTAEELFEYAVRCAKESGVIKNGDIVVLTGGFPMGISGTTNTMKVQLVTQVLVSGRSVNQESASGRVCVAKSKEEVLQNFQDGDVLVIKSTTSELVKILKKAKAIITEEEGITSHAAIVGMALGIPVIVGASDATKVLKSGMTVTVDGLRGMVYEGVVRVV